MKSYKDIDSYKLYPRDIENSYHRLTTAGLGCQGAATYAIYRFVLEYSSLSLCLYRK